MLKVELHVCGPLGNNVYLLVCPETERCAVVDPGMESKGVLEELTRRGLALDYVLNTHGHFDHIYNNALFISATGARLALHTADMPLLSRLVETAGAWGFDGAEPSPAPDILLKHGDTVPLGRHLIEVRHTPGHSPGHVAFICGGDAISGDTLFYRAIGRWDLPGADFPTLERSIKEQLYTLPDETIVWPGHGQHTTIGEEKRLNPYVGAGARLLPKL
jgi:glyoxylase-like metal-dependent hydrolase (beta-lactamase superfamily II)